MFEELNRIGIFADVQRASVDSGYQSMFELGSIPGSGDITQQYLVAMDKLPEGTRKAIDNNRLLSDVVLRKLELDESLAARLGGTRQDVLNARKIIAEGPGFHDRLRSAVASGHVLPGIAAFAIAAPSMYMGSQNYGE